MRWTGNYLAGCLLCLAFLITGCEQAPPKPAPKKAAATHQPPKKSYWIGDTVKGSPSITISLSEQRAYFFKDKTVVGESTISSGKKGFETPPGNYKVIQKDKNHVSNLYGEYVDADGTVVQKNVDVTKDPLPEGATFSGAKMPYFMRFTGGYGMHVGYVPRYRASHGCIRMPGAMAEHFFDAVEIGTPVTVIE
ncbi:MAG: L,D-transpeptidase family protein [Chthoniobacteraceae bacterium]